MNVRFLGRFQMPKNDLLDEVAYENQASDMYTQIVAKCYKAYQEELRRSEAMDFDDLIMLTLRLFDQNPDVLAYYQQRYQYIHVDEYQDTNHAQYQLVKLLASRFRISALLVMLTNPFMVGVVQICKISLILKRIIQKQKLFYWKKIIVQPRKSCKQQTR